MKRLFHLSALLIVLGAERSWAQSPVVLNPGFEEGRTSDPTLVRFWRTFNTAKRRFVGDGILPPCVAPHGGVAVVELPPGQTFSGLDTNVFNTTTLLFNDPAYAYGGGPVTFSAYYLIPAGRPLLTQAAGLMMEFRRENTSIYYSFVDLRLTGASFADGQWHKITMTISQADWDFVFNTHNGGVPFPAFPISVSLMLARVGNDTTDQGTIYWDDVEYTQSGQLGDLNHDGCVNGNDAMVLGGLSGATAGSAAFNPYAGVTGDATNAATRHDHLNVFSRGQFYLSFPLAGMGPYTASVSSVFDHSMTNRYCPNQIVTAYTGESGTIVDLNEPPATSSSACPGLPLYSYKQANGAPFNINGHYVGTQASGNSTLNYDGHPGFDYPVVVGTEVFAAADGTVVVADSVDNDGSGKYIRIQHASGYQTQYLHLSELLVALNAEVLRGDRIGRSGDTGGVAPVAPHLHFEVKHLVAGEYVAVDPYGWEGQPGSDPYAGVATNIKLWAPTICVGDLNGDHAINTIDLIQLLQVFGQSVVSGDPADISTDCLVNTLDLVLLLQHFGQTCQ